VRSRGWDGLYRLILLAPAVLRFSCDFPPPPFARGHAFACMFPRALDSGFRSVGTRFLRDLGGVSAVPCLAVQGGWEALLAFLSLFSKYVISNLLPGFCTSRSCPGVFSWASWFVMLMCRVLGVLQSVRQSSVFFFRKKQGLGVSLGEKEVLGGF
jgi:hypothetical protein